MIAIYAWGNKRRNDTFRTCVNALNRAKGRDTKFEYIKAEPEMLTLGLNGKYAIYFWREDLAKAVGKAGQDIDFEKLTDKQYLRLCKHTVKEIWRLVKTI